MCIALCGNWVPLVAAPRMFLARRLATKYFFNKTSDSELIVTCSSLTISKNWGKICKNVKSTLIQYERLNSLDFKIRFWFYLIEPFSTHCRWWSFRRCSAGLPYWACDRPNCPRTLCPLPKRRSRGRWRFQTHLKSQKQATGKFIFIWCCKYVQKLCFHECVK